MSFSNKEEVGTHRLLPRLGEPAVGVPIKKRPVSSSDRSAASTILPPWMKSLSSAPEGPVSTEQSFTTAKKDANVINKGKGIINSQIPDHANRSFTVPMANSKGVLLDGSNEIPSCAEIDGSIAVHDESKNQKFLALDLQLASCRNGKNNYGSVIKEEKLDQCFSGFHSAQLHRNVQIASGINAPCNISSGKLPNLDLNVPLDPVNSDEGLPAIHESGNVPHHGSIQHHNAQLPTISSQPGRNIDSPSLPDSYGPSHKCGPGDVTLDLQLKPPARPEIRKNWKGLAPAPGLSLSLSGTPMDQSMALSATNDLFNSDPAVSLKNVSVEAATLGTDKSPVEEAVAPVPCKANPQITTPTITGTDKTVSNNMVKREPEEPSLQHTLNDVGKAHRLEQQSVRLVNDCAEHEKTEGASRVPNKTRFVLNSDIFPNSSIHNVLDITTDNVSILAPNLPDTVPTEAMPVVQNKIQKSVKCEESTSAVPSPAVVTVSGDAAPVSMAAKSLSSGINVVNHAVGSCESSIQPPISPLDPSFSSTVWKPPAGHLNVHENMAPKPCDASQLQILSNPISEPLIPNSRGYAANDGMSHGSAEMDCSDDDDNTVFGLPTADRPQGGSSGNGPTTEDGINVSNLHKELKKELDSDMRQDSSSVTNKVSMGDVNDDKCGNRDGIVSHSGEEEHQREVSFDEESKENQLLKLDKICMPNKTDNNMHDVKAATGSCSTEFQCSLALLNPASSKIGSVKQSPATLDSCPQKTRSLDIKSEDSLSPHGKLAASSSKDYAKNAAAKTNHVTDIEEVARHSGVRPRDSIMGGNLGVDGASSGEPHSSCGRVKVASENSDEKSKPESYMATSVSNERDGQLIGSYRSDLGYAYVNRNERWERFMESEREKMKGGYQDGRHGPDMINQRRTDHCYGGRGTGSRSYLRNFRGPRMSNECPFEDDLGHLHRKPHRRRHSPPAVCRRDIDIVGFHGREIPDPRMLEHGQIEDLPDDMIQERFFRPHSHRHNAQGDHGFIHRDRSHSPAQRRGPPVHFHRGRSPETMHRSPPLLRTERTSWPYRRHTRRHGSPLDRIGRDDRGMQRNTRTRGMIGSHRALEGDTFEPPLHPAHLAGLHAEEELVDRRKYRDRRPRLRSLEAPTDDDEMLSYHLEEEMEFAECGGPRELDGRLRNNRMGHRMDGEQVDICRHRGPQGWRDVDSNDNRPKRRKY